MTRFTYLIELINASSTPKSCPLYITPLSHPCGPFTSSPLDALKVDDRDVALVLAELCNRLYPPELSDRWKAMEHGFG